MKPAETSISPDETRTALPPLWLVTQVPLMLLVVLLDWSERLIAPFALLIAIFALLRLVPRQRMLAWNKSLAGAPVFYAFVVIEGAMFGLALGNWTVGTVAGLIVGAAAAAVYISMALVVNAVYRFYDSL